MNKCEQGEQHLFKAKGKCTRQGLQVRSRCFGQGLTEYQQAECGQGLGYTQFMQVTDTGAQGTVMLVGKYWRCHGVRYRQTGSGVQMCDGEGIFPLCLFRVIPGTLPVRYCRWHNPQKGLGLGWDVPGCGIPSACEALPPPAPERDETARAS